MLMWMIMKINDILNEGNAIRLYRGLERALDHGHDLAQTDAPNGYTTWTDNPDLARQYAGEGGHVYYIDLPISYMGDDVFDDDGERALFFNNDKPAGLSGVSGDEYLVYTDHDMYDQSMVKRENNS